MSAEQENDLDKIAPPRNGYELVNKVLADAKEGEGVAKLIELADRQETEWLEFKATNLSEQDFEEAKKTGKVEEAEAELHFKIARAVISMLNRHGGVVILGIAENKKTGELDPVGWKDCLETGTPQEIDRFKHLKLFQNIIFPDKGWNFPGKQEKIVIPKVNIPKGENREFHRLLGNYVEIRTASYKKKEMILLNIQPLKKELFPVLISTRWTKKKWGAWNIDALFFNLCKKIDDGLKESQLSGKDVVKKAVLNRSMPNLNKLREKFCDCHKKVRKIEEHYEALRKRDKEIVTLYYRAQGEKGDTYSINNIGQIFSSDYLRSRIAEDAWDAPEKYESFWNRYRGIVEKDNSPPRPEQIISVEEVEIERQPRCKISVNRYHASCDEINRIIKDHAGRPDGMGRWFLHVGLYGVLKKKLEEKFGKDCCPAQNEI